MADFLSQLVQKERQKKTSVTENFTSFTALWEHSRLTFQLNKTHAAGAIFSNAKCFSLQGFS